ncbi:MAG: hypothetical protein KGI27_03410 [Thaumarchaeota archaeon]|nr:hypothetical protein [Nitrososphaerota archaeon]
MEKQTVAQRSHKMLIIIGSVAMLISFLAYWNNHSLMVTPNAMPALQRLAIVAYVIMLLSFGSIGWGLHRFYRAKIRDADDSTSSIISSVINSRKSKRIFIISAIGYGLFFAFGSGIILYKPEINFTDYGLSVPMAEISPCCGLPGQMPMILATFTEHWGFQLIPLNLLLWAVVAFLVGLNFTMMAKAFSIAKRSKGLGIFGAATGCFVGCPTCAGTIFFLLANMGITATTTATAVFLTTYGLQLQTIFMAISIPALLATPYIMAKAIRKSSKESCSIK